MAEEDATEEVREILKSHGYILVSEKFTPRKGGMIVVEHEAAQIPVVPDIELSRIIAKRNLTELFNRYRHVFGDASSHDTYASETGAGFLKIVHSVTLRPLKKPH